MAHRQYLKKINPLVQYPPATYCPANGMLDPTDPDFAENLAPYPEAVGEAAVDINYIPDPAVYPPTDPEWITLGTPATNEILLACSDVGDRNIAFNVNVSSAQTYTVEIYGSSGSPIYSQVKSSGTAFSYQFPTSGGVAASGYSTFKVKIFPTSGSYNITRFWVTTISGVPMSAWKILEARFNTPSITSLDSAFSGITDLEIIRFYSDMNALTTLANFALNTSNLVSVAFPSMNLLNTMLSTFSGSGIKYCTLPTTLPELTTCKTAFNTATRIESFSWPSTLPKLTTMESCFNGATSLKTITLPTAMVLLSSLNYTFTGCKVLKTVTMPTSLPELTTLGSTFYGCNSILNISLPGTMPKVNSMGSTFMNCYSLTTITTLPSMPLLSTFSYVCNNCYSLKSINIPSDSVLISSLYLSFQNCYELSSGLTFPTTMNSLNSWQQAFENCYKIPSIVMPTTMNYSAISFQYAFNSCYALTSFTFTPTIVGAANFVYTFKNCTSLVTATLPTTMNLVSNLTYTFSGCSALTTITMTPSLPALTAIDNFAVNTILSSISSCSFGTNQVSADYILPAKYLAAFNFPSLRVSKLSLYGQNPASIDALTSVEIDWANSTYGGTSPQILLQYCNLSETELNRIYTALPIVTGKTLKASTCSGYAASNKTIATAKGWTVN